MAGGMQGKRRWRMYRKYGANGNNRNVQEESGNLGLAGL